MKRCLKNTLVAGMIVFLTVSVAEVIHAESPDPSGRSSSNAPQTTKRARNIPRFDPTSEYGQSKLLGWRVLTNKRLAAEAELARQTRELLKSQLEQIVRVVPSKAVDRLREIPIWLELANRNELHRCACYHPSREWLTEHGFNPEKTGAVEIANAATLLDWIDEQPWMILHELAHGYHDRVLGYDSAEVRVAFEKARESGRYNAVQRYNGKVERHYALTNDKEYFAEATEAYFGRNDFFPFVRRELRRHDPTGLRLMEKVWGMDTRNEER